MAIINIDHKTHIEIILDWPETTCCICGADSTLDNCGIPHYEGFVLPNDWQGEWSCASACRRCFEKQGQLTKPVLLSQLLKE
jgi:hypothetical protein